MSTKKSAKRERLYDIVTKKGLPRRSNPLDDLMREEAIDLADEARRLRLEELVEKRKRRLSRAKQGSPILGDDSNQLLSLVQMMNSQLAQGINIASQGGKSDSISPIEYMRLFKELVLDNQKGKEKSSFFEDFAKARELGIVASPSTSESNAFSVQIEELKGNRMLNSKRLDLELHKLKLEQEGSREKLGIAAQLLGPVLALGGDKIAEDLRVKGREVAGNRRGHIGNPGNPNYTGELSEIQIKCECGFSKSLLLPSPPPSQISCPGECGRILEISVGPVSDSETASVWKSAPETRDFR